MKSLSSKSTYEEEDCRRQFCNAYENRYTWSTDFVGYSGRCYYQGIIGNDECDFVIGKDLKPQLKDIKDIDIKKFIHSQLWELAVHRIRRSFNKVHGENIFNFGDSNEIGQEIKVSGKSIGDSYRIRDNIITMVNRNIHGSLVTILTKEIFETGQGYLSSLYTSQYSSSENTNKQTPNTYTDSYTLLEDKETWVLTSRSISNNQSKEPIHFLNFDNLSLN